MNIRFFVKDTLHLCKTKARRIIFIFYCIVQMEKRKYSKKDNKKNLFLNSPQYNALFSIQI